MSLDEKLVDLFPDETPENPSENLKEADVYRYPMSAERSLQQVHAGKKKMFSVL